nr:erythromycin esterase family protein [Kibdelosporangium sp. MJ126-NF4]CEL13977.1 hypothetical protein [Kibdelosporangium sp. MJ126-NF4]CTQ88345.1 hypothetical protein [Kibdelosporangium sp. MJ126-NF4]
MTMNRLTAKAVRPLRTLDPAGPLDDLDWVDDAVGDARVVAIGESAHYNGESYQLRHRLLRYLVERHGFSAYAMESGYTEGALADRWIRGGQGDVGQVQANGVTSLMGLWTQMRAHLQWMRQHNRTTARPISFHGIDLGGSNVSLMPGLDAVTAYLTEADPQYTMDPRIRETASVFAAASAFSAPAAIAAYGRLTQETRDALTASLTDLAARVAARRLDYLQETSIGAYERALHSLRLTVGLDTVDRAMARSDLQAVMFNRDAAIADTVGWILRGEGRIVLAAHNAHIQRWRASMPGMAPVTPMGMHLDDRLGSDYRVIGVTTGTGQTLNSGADFYDGKLFTTLEQPNPDSLDGLMAASHDGPFATDLRRLSATDTATVRAVTQQRYSPYYAEVDPLSAYDVVVHLPRVTAAHPDQDALAHSPREVQDIFARFHH